MAKKKARVILVKLVSTAGTGFFYTTVVFSLPFSHPTD
jgi:ribosomal protein L33